MQKCRKHHAKRRKTRFAMERTLLHEIRHSQQYNEWKQAVLKMQLSSYPKIPKNVQVHHIHSLRELIRENNIKTLDEAINCKYLWDVNNGIVLKLGEHLTITSLFRHKYTSLGFVYCIKLWLKQHGNYAFRLIERQYLQVAMKISRISRARKKYTGKWSKYHKIAREMMKDEPQICNRCGATENLVIHHKDRDITNNEKSNLEILCRRCQEKEHRDDWKNWRDEW